MNILQTNSFKKSVKKLRANQKADLDKAVKSIMEEPSIGQLKSGDLSHVRVYKFKMVKQLTLIAYTYEEQMITLTLLTLGSHENFYLDLKKSLS